MTNSENMVVNPYQEKIVIAAVLIFGMITRLISLGWIFLVNFWLFIPVYTMVFFGQTLILLNNRIDLFRRFLLYASSILLLFFTLYQTECANTCLRLIDVLLSYFELQLFSNPKEDLSLTPAMISLYFVFGALGGIMVLLGMIGLFSPKNYFKKESPSESIQE